jgi:26S proteasome regulatory subunit N1
LALPDDVEFLRTARTIYRQQGKYAQALNLSIRVGEMDLIKEDFEQCPDP